MQIDLSPAQQAARLCFRDFVQEHISPYASQWDRDARVPLSIIDQLRDRGYLGAPLNHSKGIAMDPITYGLLTEEIARGCSSVRSLLTVHDMVALGICRWGNRDLKAEFAAPVSQGELICALALSEPDVGSDAASVQTEASLEGGEYVLS